MRLEGNVIARSGEIMAKIDFRNKINWRRRYRSPQGVETEREILRIFESDRGRIINSPAIRRLQQKTQVFPLERNAAVRTRLTCWRATGWMSSPGRSKASLKWPA